MSIRKLDPSESLWLNDLGREEVEKRVKALPEDVFKKVYCIYLEGNWFWEIPSWLEKFANLESLDLKFNHIAKLKSFTKCAFNNITLQRSEYVGMNECQIGNLNLQSGKNSHFKGCLINWINNVASSGNVFEQCKIGNPQALQVGFIQAMGFHKPLLYLILFLLATMVPDIYFAVALWHDFLSVIGLSVVIAILSTIYLLILRSFRKAEKRPNIIK